MLLETRNLTKQYGHYKAVNGVSLHIKKGAIYGFIGRNGAGKTTCLKMISGLAEATDGEIELFGYKGKDLRQIRSRVGCLIEAPGLYGSMTAYENLNIKCKLFGIKKKGYIEEILRVVGLDNVGRKKTKHFSLGMKQRLGIGLALVGEYCQFFVRQQSCHTELCNRREDALHTADRNLALCFSLKLICHGCCHFIPHGI